MNDPVYVHTTPRGAVWGGGTRDVPRLLAPSVAEFVGGCPGGVYRLLSCTQNDELQHELYCHGADVYAASAPRREWYKWEPGQLLPGLKALSVSRSAGGWWKIDRYSRLMYLLRYDLTTYRTNPVFLQLDCIRTTHAAALVALAMDPRRYLNAAKPDSSSRFRAFIGLTSDDWSKLQTHPFAGCIDDFASCAEMTSRRLLEDFAEDLWRKWLAVVVQFTTHLQ